MLDEVRKESCSSDNDRSGKEFEMNKKDNQPLRSISHRVIEPE
jgi:hypothetical protein